MPDLSPAGWAVLGVVAQEPIHGFAIAQLLAEGGELGQIWAVPRPIVYRELAKLADLALVRERGTSRSGRGPSRTIVAVTAAGGRTAQAWLHRPVDRARDARSHLLLKLALLERAGKPTQALLTAQRSAMIERIARLRRERQAAEGFDATVILWRLTSSQAVVDFVDALLAEAPGDD